MTNPRTIPHFEKTIAWLLESRTPSIRYLAMRNILGMAEGEAQVQAARQAIALVPPATATLKAQRPEGYWEQARHVYSPKYRSSHWSMLFLTELGVPPENAMLQKGAEFMLAAGENNPPWYLTRKVEGFGCFWGNWLRYMLYSGKNLDQRVQDVIAFVCADVERRGRCRYNSNLGCAWAVARDLFGLALIPPTERSAEVHTAIDTGIHFLLDEYDLLKANYPADNKKHPLWNSFSYPLYYHTDKLYVLRILKELNALAHPKAQTALDWLLTRQHKNGTWSGGSPFKSSRPFLAAPDGVERWITLWALSVLT